MNLTKALAKTGAFFVVWAITELNIMNLVSTVLPVFILAIA